MQAFTQMVADESCFGGKRERGAAGKIPVFGILKRGGKVFSKIIPGTKSATLIPISERKVVPNSIVYSDCWRGIMCWMCRVSTTFALTKPSARCADLTVFLSPKINFETEGTCKTTCLSSRPSQEIVSALH